MNKMSDKGSNPLLQSNKIWQSSSLPRESNFPPKERSAKEGSGESLDRKTVSEDMDLFELVRSGRALLKDFWQTSFYEISLLSSAQRHGDYSDSRKKKSIVTDILRWQKDGNGKVHFTLDKFLSLEYDLEDLTKSYSSSEESVDGHMENIEVLFAQIRAKDYLKSETLSMAKSSFS